MDDELTLDPTRWSEARRAVRAIARTARWDADLVMEGVLGGLFHMAADGRTLALTELLDRVCLSHRLSQTEIAGGFVLLDPDLIALEVPLSIGLWTSCGAPLAFTTVAAAGGPQVRRPPIASPRVALGPPDWLDGFGDGDLVALELFDDTLVVQRLDVTAERGLVPDPTTMARISARAADLMDQSAANGARRVAQLLAILVEGEAAGEDLMPYTPATPLGTLLEACGLRESHGWVTDDDGVDLHGMIGTESGPSPFVPEGAGPSSLQLLFGAVARSRMAMADPYDGHRADVLHALEDRVAVALVASVAARSPGIPVLADDLLAGASTAQRAALHHLVAVHHLAKGEVAAGADALQRSLDDRDVVEVRQRLAQVRWMCGDHQEAARLDPEQAQHVVDLVADLRGEEHGTDAEELLDLLPIFDDPGPDAVDRARDLWRRARWYVTTDLAGDLRAHQERALTGAGLDHGFPDEVIPDNLVEQFRGLHRFAAEVGPLLSADERRLLVRWLAQRRQWWRLTCIEGALVHLQPLDGGPATTVIGPWRPEDAAVDGWPQPDEVTSALVLPTADPDRRILGGAMFTHSRATNPALLPDAADLIATVAWMREDRPMSRGRGHGLAA